MKKILLAMCVLALSSGMAFADCDGGEMITIGEKSFCTSDVQGNWWSMQAWCQAHGMTMASVYDVCPNWKGYQGDNVGCESFSTNERGTHWTSTVNGSNAVYTIFGARKKVDRYVRQVPNARALCK